MTKLLITSDIHNRWDKALEILAMEEYDISIDLGDSEQSEMIVKDSFDHYVSGNNDYFNLPEKVIEVEGLKIAMCHGHTRGIWMGSGIEPAYAFAVDTGADIVLHGHTHILSYEKIKGKHIICPGAVNLARDSIGETYMVLTIDKGEIINSQVKKVK